MQLKQIPLLDLASEWARQSGLPRPTVLRRICEWAVCDQFPNGAFVDSIGNEIQPFDLYMAFRVLTEPVDLASGLMVAGSTVYSPEKEWDPETLQQALVDTNGVAAFCESTGTDLPSSLESFSESVRRLFSKKSLHTAPPKCPNAADRADEIYLRREFNNSLASLQRMLATLRGEPNSYSVLRWSRSDPIDQWSSRWTDNYSRALRAAEESTDVSACAQLRALNVEWEAIASVRGSIKEQQIGEEESLKEIKEVEGEQERTKRGRGRPKQSGSFAAADALLVEEIHKDIIATGSSITAAAKKVASRIAGPGTEESRVKRLTTRYSEIYPPSS